MPAKLVRLRTKPARMRAETATELRRMLLEFPGLPERERGGLIAALDRLTPSEGGWPFVMISPMQNAAVVRWLQESSRYPVLAVRLWSELFTVLRRDTGEIMLLIFYGYTRRSQRHIPSEGMSGISIED